VSLINPVPHNSMLRVSFFSHALECRKRHGDDNLRAGVGGQRGVGMHEHWIKDRRREWVDAESGDHSKSKWDTDKDKDASTLEASGSATPDREHGSTSTSSSMLARHFPQRFFILKSLTRVSSSSFSSPTIPSFLPFLSLTHPLPSCRKTSISPCGPASGQHNATTRACWTAPSVPPRMSCSSSA
jgi:hypothetical protein